MKNPSTTFPTPFDEQRRLAEVYELALVRHACAPVFDDIVQHVARHFDVPTALITVLTDDTQYVHARTGFDMGQTPRQDSFCTHAILTDRIMVVEDATQDERFEENPLVTGETGVRFYAGQPIHGPGGHKLGTLCLIDTRPRELSKTEGETLRVMARWVESEILLREYRRNHQRLVSARDDAEREAMLDSLTNILNRRGIEAAIDEMLAEGEATGEPVSLLLLDIDGFKKLNDSLGHRAGDLALQVMARRLRITARQEDFIGRWGGDEFILVAHCERDEALVLAERLLGAIRDGDVMFEDRPFPVRASIGVATSNMERQNTRTELVERADRAMYMVKESGGDGSRFA
ncbi:MAG: sensor domain-containing diguanylate cyclase [Gammaproteobacteria bacterium]|nr:sensor domain-containing diguanylate cyclase [Gammaproteobacteria bacterium]